MMHLDEQQEICGAASNKHDLQGPIDYTPNETASNYKSTPQFIIQLSWRHHLDWPNEAAIVAAPLVWYDNDLYIVKREYPRRALLSTAGVLRLNKNFERCG